MTSVIPHKKPTGFTTQTAAGVHAYSCAVEGCGFRTENPVKAGVIEAARWHRDAHKAAAQTDAYLDSVLGLRCPECTNGKHVNCDGRALHPTTDEVVRCTCTNALCTTPERNLA